MFKTFNLTNQSNTMLIINGILLVFFLTAINAIFYSIGYAFSFKIGTYIYTGDYLADLYKVSLSYPKARELMDSGNLQFPRILAPLLDVYYKYTYLGKEGLDINQLTHFHLPPLTTSIIFLLLASFSKFGFIGTTIVLLAITVSLTIFAVTLALKNRIDAYLFAFLIIISYPFIFFIQRGNFFAFFSFACIFFAIISLKRGNSLLPAILIAIAINIRPNLVIFITLLYFWPTRSLMRPFISVAISILIFIATLSFDGYIYPDYTLNNFLKGLAIYNNLFVIGDWGFGYSSSLFTLFKFLSKIFEFQLITSSAIHVQMILSLTASAYFFWLYFNRLISDASFIFIVTAISMLGTPIFADYHLLLFAVPAIYVLIDESSIENIVKESKKINVLIFFTCCLMLSPLNYINYHGLYILTLLKTIVVIIAIIYIIRQQKNCS